MTADEVCTEISGELEFAARELSGGSLNPEQLRALVEELEQQKLKRHGFKLHSAVSDERTVHFTLRFADTDELCSSMDVNPTTGKIEVQHACRGRCETSN